MENGEGMSGERSFDINVEEDTESTGETDARPFGGEEPLEETGPGVSMGGKLERRTLVMFSFRFVFVLLSLPI